ncbi:MAG: hypothetical protein ACTHK4_02710 [Mycobacteriales bacterium]
MTSFVDKIVEVDRSLAAAGIDHAFGGAICLGFHIAAPRATIDLDLNLFPSPRRARPVLQALPAGVEWSAADASQIARDGQARVFWEGTPIDMFFPQHEIHEALRERIERVPFGGTTIPILSATDLTIFKALFNRPKDWVDIAEMLAYGEVDAADVRRWLVRIVGAKDPRVAKWETATRPT